MRIDQLIDQEDVYQLEIEQLKSQVEIHLQVPSISISNDFPQSTLSY